jgi:hypothetical protein
MANCPIPPGWLVVFELVDVVVLELVDFVEPVLALLIPVVLVVLAIADVLALLCDVVVLLCPALSIIWSPVTAAKAMTRATIPIPSAYVIFMASGMNRSMQKEPHETTVPDELEMLVPRLKCGRR